MMKYSKYIVGVVFLIHINCMAQKKAVTESNQLLNKLITERNFEIKSQWALPITTSAYSQVASSGLLPPGSSVGRISITGGNYFRMIKDSVSAYLPYFGERHMGGGYGSNSGGIQFEGVPKDLEITINKKGGYNIKFLIDDKENSTENYKVYIRVLNNLNVNMSISSNQRLNIKYRGRLRGYNKE